MGVQWFSGPRTKASLGLGVHRHINLGEHIT